MLPIHQDAVNKYSNQSIGKFYNKNSVEENYKNKPTTQNYQDEGKFTLNAHSMRRNIESMDGIFHN